MDVQTSNNKYEVFTELNSGPGAHLEHLWTIYFPPAPLAVFNVEAYLWGTIDNDAFNFDYSTDGGQTFTNMLTVSKTLDDNINQSFALPSGVSGTIVIRLTDSDPTDSTLSSISIDHLYIQTYFECPTPTPSPTPSVSPTQSVSPTISPTETESPIPTESATPYPSGTPLPTRTPYNDAAIVLNPLPYDIGTDRVVPVKITFLNNGSLPWTSVDGYSLAIIGDNCALVRAATVFLPVPAVDPGENVDFQFDLHAPSAPTLCSFTVQMKQLGVRFGAAGSFNINVITPDDNAEFVSSTLPPTLRPLRTIGVGITMRNTGNLQWTGPEGYLLQVEDAVCDADISSPHEILGEAIVVPNSNYQFLAQIAAPESGSCTIRVMMKGPSGTFGSEGTLSFDVAEPTPGPNASQFWALYE